MLELAARFGLRYSGARNYTLADDYAFLPHLAQGENRYAFNVLSGSYRQSEVLVFDYHFETSVPDPKSEDQKSHYFLTPILVLVPAYFPELRIAPRGFCRKLRMPSATRTLSSNRPSSPARFACGQRTSGWRMMSATRG